MSRVCRASGSEVLLSPPGFFIQKFVWPLSGDVCQFLCRLVIFKRHPHPWPVVRFISFIAIALASKNPAEKEAAGKIIKKRVE